ncbi:MAG TPA: cytochrome P450 [Polyangiaceae bacterium]|nr:cytochrome P450 [Polyangiaceae bacterium]
MTFRRVASEAELRPDKPHGVTIDGVDLVLVCPRGKSPRAFDGHCPHQGTLLAEGEIVGGDLVCRAHGWRFDVQSGERRGEPRTCLRAYPTRLENGEVLVDLGTARRVEPAAQRPTRPLADVPGPRGWPLLGNLPQVQASRLHEDLERWAREFGVLYQLRLGPGRLLVVSDAELSETLLRSRPQSLQRTVGLKALFAEVGAAGLFSAEGDAWRAQRRLVMEALSARNLRTFFPTLRRVAERLRGRWVKAAAAGSVMEIKDELMRFTVDVTTALAFALDTNTIEGGDDVVQRHLAHIFPAVNRRGLAMFPYWRYVRLPADRALDRALGELRRFQSDLLETTRARLAKSGSTEATNLVEAMLLARDESGRPFSDEVIFGNTLTMLLAGEDTTANSTAWMLHYLCDRPDVVERARTEIDQVLAGESTLPSYEAASDLPWLDAIASEAMRLRPVAPIIGLSTIDDMLVGDVTVPAKTDMLVLTRPPALDARNFHEPERFEPARWLPGGSGAHEANASKPFGSGPRTCPGRSLALLEMRVLLATLLAHFDVERVGPREAVRERFSFTMLPEELRVRLRPRAGS